MGMDFTAYFSHDLSQDQINDLCKRLNCQKDQFPMTNRFVEDLLPHNPKDEIKEWRIDLDRIGGTSELFGPCGLSFTFSEKVCYFHHYIRWRAFLINDSIQQELRYVCYEFRNSFRSSDVIYAPDNAARESAIMDFIGDDRNVDLSFIKNWLLVNCGPPKQKIKDIYKEYEDYWVSEGYYIDDFKDFEVNS